MSSFNSCSQSSFRTNSWHISSHNPCIITSLMLSSESNWNPGPMPISLSIREAVSNLVKLIISRGVSSLTSWTREANGRTVREVPMTISRSQFLKSTVKSWKNFFGSCSPKNTMSGFTTSSQMVHFGISLLFSSLSFNHSNEYSFRHEDLKQWDW